MSVWLHYSCRSQYDGKTSFNVKHSLLRRMTPLQKSVLKSFEKLAESRPELWQKFLEDEGNQIFFSTKFGEIDASVNLTKQVLDRDFPLSPKNFQNSVYNASMGAVSIIYGFHHGYIATSDGFLSFEKSLQLAKLNVQAEICRMALVVHGFGYKSESGEVVDQSEILILSKDQSIGNHQASYHLADVINVHKDDDVGKVSVVVEEGKEQDSWLQLDKTLGQDRLAVNRFGEGVLIRWGT